MAAPVDTPFDFSICVWLEDPAFIDRARVLLAGAFSANPVVERGVVTIGADPEFPDQPWIQIDGRWKRDLDPELSDWDIDKHTDEARPGGIARLLTALGMAVTEITADDLDA